MGAIWSFADNGALGLCCEFRQSQGQSHSCPQRGAPRAEQGEAPGPSMLLSPVARAHHDTPAGG